MPRLPSRGQRSFENRLKISGEAAGNGEVTPSASEVGRGDLP